MQIGQTIWAIDPMKSFFTGNNQFTVGKAYKVETFDEITFYVKCDTGELKGILKTWFNTYFSLTPPNEKEGDNSETMITEEEYLKAKKVIADYENEQLNKHIVIDSDERDDVTDDKWVTDYCHDHTPYWGVCSTCGRY